MSTVQGKRGDILKEVVLYYFWAAMVFLIAALVFRVGLGLGLGVFVATLLAQFSWLVIFYPVARRVFGAFDSPNMKLRWGLVWGISAILTHILLPFSMALVSSAYFSYLLVNVLISAAFYLLNKFWTFKN